MLTYLVDGRRIPAHPLTDCWWLMSDVDLRELASDIEANGQNLPVTISADGSMLLDGRDRCRACESIGRPVWFFKFEDDDPEAFIRSMNEKRKHGSTTQLELVAARMADVQRGSNQHGSIGLTTIADAAEATGRSKKQVSRAKQLLGDPILEPALEQDLLATSAAYRVKDEAPEVKQEVVDLVQAEKMSGGEAVDKVLRKRRYEKAARNRAEREDRPQDDSPVEWHTCHVRELPLESDSVDYIITDPPYVTQTVEAGVWKDLANVAFRVLKPGGQLVMLSGHFFLPEIFRQLEDTGMEYRWVLSHYLPGAHASHFSKSVLTGWKPVIVYSKPGGPTPARIFDCIHVPVAMKQETEFHEWQQNEEGIQLLVEKFAAPGDVVCDPFVGGGTIPLAAKRRGCKVIAADIKQECVDISEDRLAMNGFNSDPIPVPNWGVEGQDWKEPV